MSSPAGLLLVQSSSRLLSWGSWHSWRDPSSWTQLVSADRAISTQAQMSEAGGIELPQRLHRQDPIILYGRVCCTEDERPERGHVHARQSLNAFDLVILQVELDQTGKAAAQQPVQAADSVYPWIAGLVPRSRVSSCGHSPSRCIRLSDSSSSACRNRIPSVLGSCFDRVLLRTEDGLSICICNQIQWILQEARRLIKQPSDRARSDLTLNSHIILCLFVPPYLALSLCFLLTCQHLPIPTISCSGYFFAPALASLQFVRSRQTSFWGSMPDRTLQATILLCRQLWAASRCTMRDYKQPFDFQFYFFSYCQFQSACFSSSLFNSGSASCSKICFFLFNGFFRPIISLVYAYDVILFLWLPAQLLVVKVEK